MFFLSCHLGWMNRRRYCLQKGGSQEHISLLILGYDATASSNLTISAQSTALRVLTSVARAH